MATHTITDGKGDNFPLYLTDKITYRNGDGAMIRASTLDLPGGPGKRKIDCIEQNVGKTAKGWRFSTSICSFTDDTGADTTAIMSENGQKKVEYHFQAVHDVQVYGEVGINGGELQPMNFQQAAGAIWKRLGKMLEHAQPMRDELEKQGFHLPYELTGNVPGGAHGLPSSLEKSTLRK